MIRDIYEQDFPSIDVNDLYLLREHKPSDAETFYQYYTDPLVTRYILASVPQSLEEAYSDIDYCRQLFRNRNGLYWCLARKDRDEMIGAVGLYINNFHHRAELCYDLARPYWRQGIMGQVIPAVIELAYNTIGINRLEAVTMTENQASRRLLEKVGFKHEGLLRNYRHFKGQNFDVEMYGMTPTMVKKRLRQRHLEEMPI